MTGSNNIAVGKDITITHNNVFMYNNTGPVSSSENNSFEIHSNTISINTDNLVYNGPTGSANGIPITVNGVKYLINLTPYHKKVIYYINVVLFSE